MTIAHAARRYVESVNKVERDSALSALSGQACTHAYLLHNRTRLYLGLAVAILVGAATSVLVGHWIVGSIVSFVLISVSELLSDRRIVGISANGVVQAKSALYTARPTELLTSLQFWEMQVLDGGGHDNALFRIDGTTFLGTKGSIALAGELQSRPRSSVDRVVGERP